MGLFKEDRWRCENCGETYSSNRSECDNCGHTVFQQHNPDTDQSDRSTRPRPQTGSDSSSVTWRCANCKQKHDEPRDACKVCGTTEFDKVGSEPDPAEKPSPATSEPSEETISNISEIPTTETTPDSSGNGLLWVYALSALAIFILIVVSSL